jgi:hypothetical protein
MVSRQANLKKFGFMVEIYGFWNLFVLVMFCYSSGLNKLWKLFGKMFSDFDWYNYKIQIEYDRKCY